MVAEIDVTFDNVAVSVTDMERSIEWYRLIFGFRLKFKTFITTIDADFVIMERDDFKIEFLHRRGSARAEEMIPGPHLSTSGLKAIVFRTNDLDAVTAHLERLNIPLVWKLETISADGLRATMIRDPDGHLINILQYPAGTIAVNPTLYQRQLIEMHAS